MSRLFFSAKGFTLVELIVSVSIMVVVLTITLSSRPDAILRLSVSDAQSQAELLIRKVQLQGSSIASANSVYGGAGVFFDLATGTVMFGFRDKVDETIASTLGVGNGIYDYTPTPEPKEVLTLNRGNRFGKLCVSMSTSSFMCNTDNDPEIRNLTISFNRPSQRAHIYINGATSTDYVTACVQVDSVRSPLDGYVKSIYVYRSGLIVKANSACI